MNLRKYSKINNALVVSKQNRFKVKILSGRRHTTVRGIVVRSTEKLMALRVYFDSYPNISTI